MLIMILPTKIINQISILAKQNAVLTQAKMT